MDRALFLAGKNSRRVSPNPVVGCVIVKDNVVLGKGWHDYFGGPHAEVAALAQAGKKAQGATAYVTLEPCCHTGKKTPPCVPLLLSAGIIRVVIALRDPNMHVNGQGILQLRQAGVDVTVGVRFKKASFLNRMYCHFMRTKTPWVTLKMASSLDGKTTSSRRWISNESSRLFVHRLRAEHDAILVGKGTVLADNPHLTCRIKGWPDSPLRVILDSQLETPLSANVYADKNVLVACTSDAPLLKMEALKEKGIDVVVLSGKKQVDLNALLSVLAQRNIASLLVEGGATVASSFLSSGLVDEGYFFVAPFFSGQMGIPMYSGMEKRFEWAIVNPMQDNACLHVLKKAIE